MGFNSAFKELTRDLNKLELVYFKTYSIEFI